MRRNSRFPGKLKIMALLAGCSLTPLAQAVAATPPSVFSSDGATVNVLASSWENHQSLWLAANGTPSAPQFEPIKQVRVGEADTLWSLARDQRPQGVTIKQAMLGILEANPSAFTHHNINALGAGNVIQIPDANFMQQYSAAEASQEVNRQNQVWPQVRRTPPRQTAAELAQNSAGSNTSPNNTSANNTSPSTSPVASESSSPTGSSKAVPAESTAVEATSITTPASDTDTDTSSVEPSSNARLSALQTEVRSLTQERDQLQRQLRTLQDQLKTAQQLMTIKDQQLSELKDRQDSLSSQMKARPETPSAQPAASNASSDTAGAETTTDPTTALLDSLKQQPMLYGGGGAAILGLLALVMGMRRSRKLTSEQNREQPSSSKAKAEANSEQADKSPFEDLPALDDLDMSNEDFEALLMQETASQSDESSPELPLTTSASNTALQGQSESIQKDVAALVADGRLEQAAGLLQRHLSEQPDDDSARLRLMALLVQLDDRDTFDHHYHALMARIPAPEARYEADLLAAELNDKQDTSTVTPVTSAESNAETQSKDEEVTTFAAAEPLSEVSNEDNVSNEEDASTHETERLDREEAGSVAELMSGTSEGEDLDDADDMDELDELDLSEFDDEFSAEQTPSEPDEALIAPEDNTTVTPEHEPAVVLEDNTANDETDRVSLEAMAPEQHEAYGQVPKADEVAAWLDADTEVASDPDSSPAVVLDDPLAQSLDSEAKSNDDSNAEVTAPESSTTPPDELALSADELDDLTELEALDERDLGLDDPLEAEELSEQEDATDLEPLEANTDTDEFMAALDGLSLDESLTEAAEASDAPLIDESVSEDDLEDLEALFGLNDDLETDITDNSSEISDSGNDETSHNEAQGEETDESSETIDDLSELGALELDLADVNENEWPENEDSGTSPMNDSPSELSHSDFDDTDFDDLADLDLPELSGTPQSEDLAELDTTPQQTQQYSTAEDGSETEQSTRSWEDELAELEGLEELDYDAEFPADDIESNMATQLDLANAYVEMGDAAGAREVLNHVLSGGNETQRKAAQALLERLNAK